MKDLGFESVDLRSDLGFIWGLIVFMRVWMILLGFEIIKVEGLVGFNIFLRVWLILVEIGNNKIWFFFLF